MGRYSRMQGPPDRPLDTTPIEMPLGAGRPESLDSMIARMVRQVVAQESGNQQESFEEADDFEEEDPEILDFSKYELQTLHEEASVRGYSLAPDKEFGAPNVDPEGSQVVQKDKTGDRPDPNAVEPDKP